MVEIPIPPVGGETKRTRPANRHRVRAALLWAAAALLTISAWLPYWEMTLVPPGDTPGIRFDSRLTDLHRPLQSALSTVGGWSEARARDLTRLERSLAVAMATVIGLLLVAATLGRRRWTILLALPACCFPPIVVADSARTFAFGPLAGGGFMLETQPGAGLFLSFGASIAVIAGVLVHFSDRRSSFP